MSSMGLEVLFGLNQRPERVSIPTLYFLQERTYLRYQTPYSWLKQTILFCYKQADQQSLDLAQVKVHDIRAYAVSKAFYGGVLVDQIMQSSQHIHKFYLKDLIWSDDKNMYLGPVVAAQQVLNPSPQTRHPREEKKGGHIRCSQVFRSLNPRVKVYDYLLRMFVRSFIFYFSYFLTRTMY